MDLFGVSSPPPRAAEHKPTGCYQTPSWACEALIEKYYADLNSSDTVVEPSCGEGHFLDAIPREVPAVGIELDPVRAAIARQRTGREVIVGDVLSVDLAVAPTLILGNPPFKSELIDGLLDRAYQWLPDGGRAGLLLPAFVLSKQTRVVRESERWSIEAELVPRDLFPGPRLPIVFARFRKERRRTRQEVGRELPELTEVIHAVEADAQALDNLKGDAIALAKVVLAHNESYRGERMNAAGKLDSLIRQATGIAKAPYVAEFAKLLLDSEQRIVLFGWHREVYNIWLERLKEFNPVLYTGTESVNQKAASIEQFLSGKSRILVMSLRSGAGVDGLQGSCRTAVFGELDWSPGVHEQCVGRIHRDGQPEPCVAYFLVAEEGADPIMVDVLGIKREQIEGVRNPNRALAERLDTGENNIKRLAREFLIKRGVKVNEERELSIDAKEAV